MKHVVQKITITASIVASFIGINASNASATEEPYCREYQQVVLVGDEEVASYGEACLQPDGAWKIMSNSEGYSDAYGASAEPVIYSEQAPRVIEREIVYVDRPVYVNRHRFGSGIRIFTSSHRPYHYGYGKSHHTKYRKNHYKKKHARHHYGKHAKGHKKGYSKSKRNKHSTRNAHRKEGKRFTTDQKNAYKKPSSHKRSKSGRNNAHGKHVKAQPKVKNKAKRAAKAKPSDKRMTFASAIHNIKR